MAFCTSCGAPVEGRFCVKCGAPAGAAAPAAPPRAAAPAPMPAAAPGAAKKKISPIVWILVGILGLIVLVVVGVVGAGAYLAYKVKQNPALAMTRILTAANPDVEVLSSDAGKGTLTVRDKKTGKVVTMNFDDIKNGRFSVQEEGKEAVTMEARGAGQNGAFQVRSGNQVMNFGANADKVPSWVPTYPGAKMEGTFSMQGGEGEGGSFQLTTSDAAEKVLAHYESALKGGGFKILSSAKTEEGGMIIGENAGRSVTVTISKGSGQTTIGTIYGVKRQ